MSDTMATAVWDAATGVKNDKQIAKFKGPMEVKRADHLRGLGQFTSLRMLSIIGGDCDDLTPLAKLRALRSLKIVGAKVRNLKPLAGLSELEELEINFTRVEDLSPIEQLTNLGWLRLFGNPLADKSYRKIVDRKRTTEVERWGRPCIVEISGEDEWQRCRKLFESGAKVCWGSMPRFKHTLLRPGDSGMMLLEFSELSVDGIVAILAARDPAKAPEVTNIWPQEGVEHSHERFGVMWQSGRPVDVARWMGAATWLPDEERDAYLRFVARFPSETFYVEHDSFMPWQVVRHGAPVPAWFEQLRTHALAGVRPHESTVDVRIAASDASPTLNAPRAKTTKTAKATKKAKASKASAAAHPSGWYRLGWVGFKDLKQRALLRDRLGLLPIAESASGHSVLAIRLRDDDDQAVYEVDPLSAKPSIVKVFASHSALMDRITALRTDGVVTEA